MKIGYLVFNLDGMGGTSRSAITQANALAGDHAVTLLSVTRSGERPHYWIDERIKVRYLVDVREGQDPSVPGVELAPSQAAGAARARLARRPRRVGRPVHRAVRRRARARAARPQARRPRHGHPRAAGRGHPAAAARARRRAPGAPLHLRPVVRARAAAELRPARRRRRRLHPRDGRLGPRAARRLHPRDRDRPEPPAPRLHPALAPRQPARDDGRPAGQREAVPTPDRGLRPGRRPAARVAAAHLRHRPEAAGAAAPRPQARPLRPGGAARRRGRHARRVGQGEHLRAHLARRGLPARGPGGDGGRRPRRQLRLRLRPARDHPARGQRPARLARVDRGHGRRPCCGWPPTTTCAARSARAPSGPHVSTTRTPSPSGGSASSAPRARAARSPGG